MAFQNGKYAMKTVFEKPEKMLDVYVWWEHMFGLQI